MTHGSFYEEAPSRTQRKAFVRAARRAAVAALLLAAGIVAGSAPASAYSEAGRRAVVDAALKGGVPPELALAVARVGALRASRVGDASDAVGVMRVRPSVAREEFGMAAYQMRGLRPNAGIGVALLERLHRRYGERWDLALSHYRGGSLQRCEGGPVVHEHTTHYVADVMEWWRRYQKDEAVASLVKDVRKSGFRGSRFTKSGDRSAPKRGWSRDADPLRRFF